jgi:hypothetical protein
MRADEKYIECPTACVECDRVVPLNKSGVCEECWNNGLNSTYEEWKEKE